MTTSATPSTTAAAPAPRRTPTLRDRLIWPGGLFAMIGAVIAIDVTMLVVSSGDPSFAVHTVDGDPGDAWQRDQAERRASDALAWKAAVLPELVAGDAPRLAIQVQDRDGAPLEDLSVVVRAYHHARAKNVREVTLRADGATPGRYVAALDFDRDGQWHVGVRATRDDAVFVSEQDVFVILPDRMGERSNEHARPAAATDVPQRDEERTTS